MKARMVGEERSNIQLVVLLSVPLVKGSTTFVEFLEEILSKFVNVFRVSYPLA